MNNIDSVLSPTQREMSARANFKRFVAVIYKLLKEDQIYFDVLIVGGNSGIVMGRYTQMIYEKLALTCPPILMVAPVRYKLGTNEFLENPHPNKHLGVIIKQQLEKFTVHRFRKVLFVDDEIGGGSTAKACIESLIAAVKPDYAIDYYIVAENHGFKAHSLESGYVTPHFLPFARKINHFHHLLMHTIPFEIDHKIKHYFGREEIDNKLKVCLLLDLPSRDKADHSTGFTYPLNERAQIAIPNLGELQQSFQNTIYLLIEEALIDCKNNKIDLADYGYADKIIPNALL